MVVGRPPNVVDFPLGEMYRIELTKTGFILWHDETKLIDAGYLAETDEIDVATELIGQKNGYFAEFLPADVKAEGHTVYEARSAKLTDAKIKDRLTEIEVLMKEKDSL